MKSGMSFYTMITLLFLCLFAGCATPGVEAQPDLVFGRGGDSIRITGRPCKDEKVLQHIDAVHHSRWKESVTIQSGVAYASCYFLAVVSIDEDGDTLPPIPLPLFAPIKEKDSE